MTNSSQINAAPTGASDEESRIQAQIDAVECCHHTNGLVRGLADGSAKGLARWYGQFHVATCKTCTVSLATLTDLNAQMDSLTSEDPTR